LIISGQVGDPEEREKKYITAAQVAAQLQRDEHYEVDEKNRNILLSDEGFILAEKILGVTDLLVWSLAGFGMGIFNWAVG